LRLSVYGRLSLVKYALVEATKADKSKDVSKYTVIWKVCTGEEFSVKISGNIGINFRPEISGLSTLPAASTHPRRRLQRQSVWNIVSSLCAADAQSESSDRQSCLTVSHSTEFFLARLVYCEVLFDPAVH